MKKNLSIIIALIAFITAGCSSANSKEDTGKDKGDAYQQNIGNNNKKDMENLTKVLISTSLGDITIALYDETPKHKENFLKLAGEGYYDNVLFHRIIKNFMIQTGDPDSKNAAPGQPLGMGGPDYRIPAEFVPELYHKRGAIAAARMGDNVNPKKESSGSQFYIVDGKKWTRDEMNQISTQMRKTFSAEQIETYTTIGGDPFLDGDYTVFGEVVSGMDVVDMIAAQPKDGRDRPLTDIKILSTKIVEE